MNHLKKLLKTNWERKVQEVPVDSDKAIALREIYRELSFVKIELEALSYVNKDIAGIKAMADAELKQWQEQNKNKEQQEQKQQEIKPDLSF